MKGKHLVSAKLDTLSELLMENYLLSMPLSLIGDFLQRRSSSHVVQTEVSVQMFLSTDRVTVAEEVAIDPAAY